MLQLQPYAVVCCAEGRVPSRAQASTVAFGGPSRLWEATEGEGKRCNAACVKPDNLCLKTTYDVSRFTGITLKGKAASPIHETPAALCG